MSLPLSGQQAVGIWGPTHFCGHSPIFPWMDLPQGKWQSWAYRPCVWQEQGGNGGLAGTDWLEL